MKSFKPMKHDLVQTVHDKFTEFMVEETQKMPVYEKKAFLKKRFKSEKTPNFIRISSALSAMIGCAAILLLKNYYECSQVDITYSVMFILALLVVGQIYDTFHMFRIGASTGKTRFFKQNHLRQ
ncbi:uncharacterized protein LOC106669049 [Cimex lectularius]|uniref:Uncharacterized protein n=1 Tax=Cimex lectularius TaxID=79782 RepID=A0A8I6RY27_CIMLE|nr:uncharacterized protein LOC106669049 [Cimex lectularius]